MSVTKGPKDIKKLKMTDQPSDVKDLTLERLKDEYLLEILQYLTFAEKMRLQSVCKNLNRVAKISLKQIRSLKLEKILPFTYIKDTKKCMDSDDEEDEYYGYNNYEDDEFSYDEDEYLQNEMKEKNVNYLKKFLKKCGKFLNIVNINTYYIKYLLSSRMLIEIFKSCHNLTDVVLYEGSGESIFTDKNLKILFSNNPNISSISIEHIQIVGDCLLELNADNIKKLKLLGVNFKSKSFLTNFLKNLKNLNKLELYGQKHELVEIMDALISSQCDNIFEIDIMAYFEYYSLGSVQVANLSNLSLFVSKQKEIRKFALFDVSFDQQILDKFPKNKLEELSLKFKESAERPYRRFVESQVNQTIDLSFLSEQNNIRKLKLKNVSINEKLTEGDVNILKAFNLEELSVEFSKVASKENVLKFSLFLSRLKKVNKIRFANILIDDKFIKNLCTEYVEVLDLDFQDFYEGFNEMDLSYLARFQNLKSLKVFFFYLVEDELETLFKGLNKNVKKIEIFFNDMTTDHFPSVRQIIKFNNLESLSFDNSDNRSDANFKFLFRDLHQCRKLSNLSLKSCELKILRACNLPNLLTLELKNIYLKDDEILDFIRNAIKLRELKFTKAYQVTNNLIKKANEVKFNRGDTHVLKIFIDNKCINIDFYELENAPLVKAIYY